MPLAGDDQQETRARQGRKALTTTGANGKRGEGQWALGYREPLNKNEENKRNDDGLNVRQRILDIYSRYGFDSIDPGDLRGRFRWYGLYTQRRPGIAGTVRVTSVSAASAVRRCPMAAVNWYSQPGAVLDEPRQWQAPLCTCSRP
jgi:hypothetical protein